MTVKTVKVKNKKNLTTSRRREEPKPTHASFRAHPPESPHICLCLVFSQLPFLHLSFFFFLALYVFRMFLLLALFTRFTLCTWFTLFTSFVTSFLTNSLFPALFPPPFFLPWHQSYHSYLTYLTLLTFFLLLTCLQVYLFYFLPFYLLAFLPSTFFPVHLLTFLLLFYLFTFSLCVEEHHVSEGVLGRECQRQGQWLRCCDQKRWTKEYGSHLCKVALQLDRCSALQAAIIGCELLLGTLNVVMKDATPDDGNVVKGTGDFFNQKEKERREWHTDCGSCIFGTKMHSSQSSTAVRGLTKLERTHCVHRVPLSVWCCCTWRKKSYGKGRQLKPFCFPLCCLDRDSGDLLVCLGVVALTAAVSLTFLPANGG